MIDEQLFSATFPWDMRADAAIRGVKITDPDSLDPLAPLNQRELIHDGSVTGHEGSDYQNPYAFASGDVFDLKGADLRPNYGIRGDTAGNVALNVVATSGFILK